MLIQQHILVLLTGAIKACSFGNLTILFFSLIVWLEHHQSSIASIVSAVDTLKSAVEEKKFMKGESEDTIKTWSGEIEQHLEKADQATKRVQSAIQAIDMEEQEKRAFENHKQQMEFEREILEQKAKFEKDREQQKLTTQTT